MNRSFVFAAFLPLSVLAACGGAPAAPVPPATPEVPSAIPAVSAVPTAAPTAEAPAAKPPAAGPVEVAIEARSGSKLAGTATFTPVDGGVKVSIKVSGAPPGQVATHVHETGDCSSPDGKSAGGHFNPAGHKHGLPDGERHLGDLGNIDVKPDGTGTRELTVTGANLVPGDPSSYLGKAIIVHEKKDDGGQPVGNAGSRIGCGVIGPKK